MTETVSGSNPWAELSPTTLSDILPRKQVMNIQLRPLYDGMKRIAGPAFIVKCPAGDNLMLHAAIYRAPAGSVIVVESADSDYAVAGGNVCAIAQKNGVAGFVVDGVIRDVAESRERGFPVIARGVIPIPGGKEIVGTLNEGVIVCGGVAVEPGDIIVGDEEGVVVVPKERTNEVLALAQAKARKDAAQSLEEWEKAHRAKIDAILKEKGFVEKA